MKDLTTVEQLLIERAIAAGKVTRAENGSWPDCDRIEVMRYVSPSLRGKIKRQKAEAEAAANPPKAKGKKT